MRFALDQEQADLQAVVREVLAKGWPGHELVPRSTSETPHDQALWLRLVADLGLAGLTAPEDRGGLDASLVDVAVVACEAGRALYPGPLLATAIGVRLLARADSVDVSGDVLEHILEGGRVVGLAGFDPTEVVDVVARLDGDRWRLDGVAEGISDAARATDLLVRSTGPDGDAIFLVPIGPDVRITPRPSLDVARPVSTLRLDGAVGSPLSGPEETGALLVEAEQLALVYLSAEAVGSAEACLEMAIAHARQRRQFGRPIGSFQAVQHRSASTALAVEGARAAMWNSSWEATHGPDTVLAASHVTMARSVSASAFVTAAESLIQTLGGIGFTWEHPVHLYYRRALSARMLFLTVEQARERVAADLVDS